MRRVLENVRGVRGAGRGKRALATMAAGAIALSLSLPAYGQVTAQLRAAAGYPAGNFIAPTAPAGGVVEGQHFWGCDGLQSFIRYNPADPANIDPVNTGILIPTITGPNQISLIMTKCAQVAFDGNRTVFVADYENRKGSGGTSVSGRNQEAGV